VQAICDIIEHVINPNSCLLPGYLAVNEIRQTMTDEQILAPPVSFIILLLLSN